MLQVWPGKYVINSCPSAKASTGGHRPSVRRCMLSHNRLLHLCDVISRQVDVAKVGLQHNLGLGSACVATMYKRPDEWLQVTPKRKASGAMGFDGEQIQAKL